MKSLLLLFLCATTCKGYAPYYWTLEDRLAIIASGSSVDAERSVCESHGHVFTQGNEALAPGCGDTWCCQTGFAEHYWTPRDRAAIAILGSNVLAEKSVCENLGHVFTQGNGVLAPGCGDAWCCQKAGYAPYSWTSDDRVAIAGLGKSAPAKKAVCESLGHVFTQGYDVLAPGCGDAWCCQKMTQVNLEQIEGQH